MQRRVHVALYLGAALALSGGTAGAQTEPGCSASDQAPDSIPMRTAPTAVARALRVIVRDSASTLVNVDAAGDRRGDWLKVRARGSAGWVAATSVTCRLSSGAARDVIARDAARVIAAVKAGDMMALARQIHPAKGVRLSPYATIDTATDVVMTAAQLDRAFRDPRARVWGVDDGSGQPIRLPFRRYYRQFVYDREFAGAPLTTYNDPGEGTRKVWDAYPSAIVAAFAFPETGTRAAESLRLVFERHHGAWYLAGIVHDGWTI